MFSFCIYIMINERSSATYPLFGSSFNAIAVGFSNGNSENGSYALGSLYFVGRPEKQYLLTKYIIMKLIKK
jgi:hypothetical protein